VVFNSSDQAQPQQLWLMLPVLREPGVYVNFAYNNSGKCMDVTGMVTSNATTVQLWNFENNANQKWSIRTIR